jgi:hypothetical protein
MGAKASTNGNQSPRATFSNSSSSDVVSADNSTSFNFLRAIHGVDVPGNSTNSNDPRQRTRSMSSVSDLQSSSTTGSNPHHHHHHHHHHANYCNSRFFIFLILIILLFVISFRKNLHIELYTFT